MTVCFLFLYLHIEKEVGVEMNGRMRGKKRETERKMVRYNRRKVFFKVHKMLDSLISEVREFHAFAPS